MPALEPYTSTYSDVDGSVIDADDLVDEFWRVSHFMTMWAGSIEAIGREDHYEEYIQIVTGQLAEILPQNGLIQRLDVDASVVSFEVKINEHVVGDPYRVYINLRCRNKDTRFTLSTPSHESHVFGINREEYMPAQVISDGFYTATLICSYSQDRGVLIQVMAANPEETAIDFDDVLTIVPK
jgi:hypothetical protein